MSDRLFPHRVLKKKTEGFIFVVIPEDDDVPDLVLLAKQAEELLNKKFEAESATGMTPKDARNHEESEMIYADAVTLLEENEFPASDWLVISSVINVGDLVVVTASLGEPGDEEEDEEEDEDDDYE